MGFLVWCGEFWVWCLRVVLAVAVIYDCLAEFQFSRFWMCLVGLRCGRLWVCMVGDSGWCGVICLGLR